MNIFADTYKSGADSMREFFEKIVKANDETIDALRREKDFWETGFHDREEEVVKLQVRISQLEEALAYHQEQTRPLAKTKEVLYNKVATEKLAEYRAQVINECADFLYRHVGNATSILALRCMAKRQTKEMSDV